jgi:hypothetical protein
MYNDPDVMDEPMYTFSEIAERWKIHRTTARRLFIHQKDVLKIGLGPGRGKREHITYRVPLRVVQRVLGRISGQ